METTFDALQIEVTNKCQLDCAECPRRLMTRPIGDMNLDLAKMMIEEAYEAKNDVTVVVNGLGDPILYPHLGTLFEFVARLWDRGTVGPTIQFFTNLSIPKEKCLELFKVVRRLDVPILVATTKHIYDGKGVRAPAVSRFYDENIVAVRDMVRDNPKIDLHAHMVINKFHTHPDIELFFKHFQKILPEDHVHITKQLNPWFDLMSEMAGQDGPDPAALSKPGSGPECCHYPFKTCHIGWDGEMIICCTDDVNQECTFGKVEQKGDLLKLWNGAKLRAIRDQFNRFFDNDFSTVPKPCSKCYRLAWLKNGNV